MIAELINSILNIKIMQITTLFKLLFIIVLIIASVFARDFTFIKEYPMAFIGETLLYALLPMITTYVSVMLRNKKEDIKKKQKEIFAMIGGIGAVFAVVSILHQTSGLYTNEFHPPGFVVDKEKQAEVIKYTGYGFLFTIFLILVSILIANIIKYRKVKKLSKTSFMILGLELSTFVVLNSLIVLYSAKFRTGGINDHSISAFIKTMGLMFAVYIVFQISGANNFNYDYSANHSLVNEYNAIDGKLLIDELKHIGPVGKAAIKEAAKKLLDKIN